MKKLFLALLVLNTPLFADDLVDLAVKAREKAYAPYSKFYVGCAVMSASGRTYTGCNIENASYGLTNCAERTAIFKAVSEGDKEIVRCVLSVCGGGSPCGACRQVLNEFNPNMELVIVNEKGEVREKTTPAKLLPQAFGPHNLE